MKRLFNRVLLSIIKKEFIHMVKDPQTLMIIIAMPLIMLLLFGYAITLDLRNIPTMIRDYSHSQESREFVNALTSSGFFKRVPEVDENSTVIFQQRLAKCILVIPTDFADHVNQAPQAAVQALIDASDPNSAQFVAQYLNAVAAKMTQMRNGVLVSPFQLTIQYLYNPQLNAAYFFVPGLMAVILLLVSALLTSIAIAREKETGTMEQLLVSPVSPAQIMIGKVLPYLAVGFLSGLTVLFAGGLLFHVPNNGSLLLTFLMMILYIFSGLSLGLLISTIATSQQAAMLMAMMMTMLPSMMLSGFMFPVESMPLFFRIVSKFIPATHFVQIIRGILLKGVGIRELGGHILILACISIGLTAMSIRKFKTTLE